MQIDYCTKEDDILNDINYDFITTSENEELLPEENITWEDKLRILEIRESYYANKPLSIFKTN